VIVPARDAEATLGDCLDALRAQVGAPAAWEVIVVDDGSRDATLEIASRAADADPQGCSPAVRVIARHHAGAAAARNAGVAAAEGDILAFTDSDCRPEPEWLDRMCGALADDRASAAMGRFKSDQTGVVARFVQAEYADKEAGMLARRWVTFADTATAAFRADVMRQAGGFREDLMAVEDTDYAFRLAAAGHRIAMVPGAFVYHRHPETWLGYARRKYRFGRWGALVYAAHPERVADDSRTPAGQRLQMALVPVGLLLLGLAAAGRASWGAVLAAAVLHGASCAPQAWRASGRHPAVRSARLGWRALWVVPWAAAIRAVALDAGIAIGMADLLRRRSRVGRVPRPRARKLSAGPGGHGGHGGHGGQGGGGRQGEGGQAGGEER